MSENPEVRPGVASAVALSLSVAAAIGALSTWLVVAVGETNGYENLVIISLCTFGGAFFAALAMTRQRTTAAVVSFISTGVVVGAGFALLSAIFASLCGSSDC